MGVGAHGCLLLLGARPGSRVEVARLTVVSGAGVFVPDGEDRMLADRRRGGI
jgi:hypothetical protein